MRHAESTAPGPEGFFSRRFTTTEVPASQRGQFWTDAICATFVRLDFRCDMSQPFFGDLTLRRTARFDLIDVLGSPQQVGRSQQLIAKDPTEHLIVMFQRQGHGTATQDGQDFQLRPLGLTVLDSRRPYELRFPCDFRQTVIKVPSGELDKRIGNVGDFVGHEADFNSPLSRLAIAAIDEIACEARETVAATLSAVTLDLLALALVHSRDNKPTSQPMQSLRVRWAMATVLEFLREPELSPRWVAARQGISLRLLQRVFALEGLSLSDYIVEQRLVRCARDLQDPKYSTRRITEIAFSWGFADASHFGKAFRRRFGMSPREARVSPAFAPEPDAVR